jgi:hypothetical protein
MVSPYPKYCKGGTTGIAFGIDMVDGGNVGEVLEHFWSGHAQAHVSERYKKLLTERDYSLDWAEKIGTGFDLPSSVGKPGKLHLVRKSA